MKEWYSASELSELLDKSLRSIQKSSKLQNWNFQIREGKTREYHIDNLPLAIKSEILKKFKDNEQKQDIIENSLSALTKLNASDLQKVEIRENIIKAFQTFKNDTGLSNSKAGERFCEKYNNKELLNEPLIHQSFSYISKNTILNWQKNYKTAGVSGLADNYGNRKGMTKVDSNPQIRDFILGLIYEKPHVQCSKIMEGLRARFDRSTLPSYRTIQNWVLKWKEENQSLLLAITNPDAWKNKFQAAGGSQSENIIRLNQRWEFDSTPTYADIINDVYEAVEKAIANGETLATFQKNLTPVLQSKGWWGQSEDGVQLGSPRRLRTIYDTNLRASYAAGRWERIQKRKSFMPYLRYICVLDEKTRAEHRKFHDIILPVDDSFWLTHYPPNGWHCRCIVQQLSLADVERLGLSITQSPEIIYKEWENKQTGEIKMIPEGIVPGFDYNVGVANLRVKARQQVADKLKVIKPNIAQSTIKNLVQEQDFADFYDFPQGNFVVGIVDELTKTALKAQTSVCLLSDETLLKNQKKHHDLKLKDYGLINNILNDYDILVQDSDKSVVAVKKIDGKNYWLAVKVTRYGNEIFTNTYHLSRPADIERLKRQGKVLK